MDKIYPTRYGNGSLVIPIESDSNYKNMFLQSPNPFADDNHSNLLDSPNLNYLKADNTESNSFNHYMRPEEENSLIKNFCLNRSESSYDIQDMFKNNTYDKENENEGENRDRANSMDESYFSITSFDKKC
jgi:hypothetical protein